MFLNPKIAAKESSIEVWDCKLFNERQLLSPAEKSSPLWLSLFSSPSLLAAVNRSSFWARKVVQISVGRVVFSRAGEFTEHLLQENIPSAVTDFPVGPVFSLISCMRYSTVPL